MFNKVRCTQKTINKYCLKKKKQREEKNHKNANEIII